MLWLLSVSYVKSGQPLAVRVKGQLAEGKFGRCNKSFYSVRWTLIVVATLPQLLPCPLQLGLSFMVCSQVGNTGNIPKNFFLFLFAVVRYSCVPG